LSEEYTGLSDNSVVAFKNERIKGLNRELELYESKYGLLSKDFYELYANGELPDEDIVQIDEYGRWAAFYQIKLEREATYETLAQQHIVTLRASAPASELALAVR